MSELYRTVTSHHDKSTDKFCGLDVKYITYIVISFMVSVLILLMCFPSNKQADVSMTLRFIFSFIPFLGTLSYTIFFFFNRMPHFHEDFWISVLMEKNFKAKPMRRVNMNPFMEENP